MADNNLLEVKDLVIDFVSESGITHAVKDISFTIKKGETIAVVGESGSGKTVTSLSVLRLLPPTARITSGEIIFNDKDQQYDLLKTGINSLRSVRGNKISMIFQEPMTSLNPVKTCGSQVAEVIRLHQKVSEKIAHQKTIRLFSQVKLPYPESVYKRFPHELSGGQKQRVMIAMAISCGPSLLIADEPTTALDVTVQKEIILLLKELQQSMGMSIMYITHDLGLVAGIADRVIVMFRGKIIETGDVKSIFSDPKEIYTKALLSCHPNPGYKGKRLPVISDFMEDKEFHPEVKNDISIDEPVHEIKPENTSGHFLVVKDLTVTFPVKKNFLGKTLKEFTAVDYVSFTMTKGETLGLVGESGCGKTTLGRALIRLVEASSGQVILNGTDILQMPVEQMRQLRKDIQIVFQDPYGSLNPRLTIGNAVKEPMAVHHLFKNEKQRKDKAVDLLEKVGLSGDQYNRYPHEFSGGQRQRICIARALSLSPGFIICDESVSALDVSVQAQVLNLLSDLKKEYGFTTIFISHDLSVVHYFSDRIMVMSRGRIIETGSADQVFFNPRDPYTKELISAIPKAVSF